MGSELIFYGLFPNRYLTYGTNRGIVQNAGFSLNSSTNCAAAASFITVYLMGSGPLDGVVTTESPVPTE